MCAVFQLPDCSETSPGVLQEVLSLLEKHINDKDIQEEIKSEQDEIPYVKASTGRLERDVYDKLIVGDYHERTRNRTAVREKQRKQYEVCTLGCFSLWCTMHGLK